MVKRHNITISLIWHVVHTQNFINVKSSNQKKPLSTSVTFAITTASYTCLPDLTRCRITAIGIRCHSLQTDFWRAFFDARSVFNWRFLGLFFRFYSNLSRVSDTYKSFITLTLLWHYNWTLHGSKVSRESNLCSVPYNRPVGVRSFVKNVKSLNENQHNSWTVQDNSMKLHRLTQLVKMCVVDKNENFCSFRFLVIYPLI